MYGLGIPHVGEQTAKDISKVFHENINEFWTYLKNEAGLDSLIYFFSLLIIIC